MNIMTIGFTKKSAEEILSSHQAIRRQAGGGCEA